MQTQWIRCPHKRDAPKVKVKPAKTKEPKKYIQKRNKNSYIAATVQSIIIQEKPQKLKPKDLTKILLSPKAPLPLHLHRLQNSSISFHQKHPKYSQHTVASQHFGFLSFTQTTSVLNKQSRNPRWGLPSHPSLPI